MKSIVLLISLFTSFLSFADGNANGKPAPFGTYIYHTTLTDDMGITFVKSGEVVLIR